MTSKESDREVQCDRDELLMNMDTQSLHMVPHSCMDEINLCLGLIVNEKTLKKKFIDCGTSTACFKACGDKTPLMTRWLVTVPGFRD